MLSPDILKEWIARHIDCQKLEVAGDGRHFEALIVSDAFTGKNRVARQQHVYAALRDKLDSGELHALTMRTLTPEEWKVQNG